MSKKIDNSFDKYLDYENKSLFLFLLFLAFLVLTLLGGAVLKIIWPFVKDISSEVIYGIYYLSYGVFFLLLITVFSIILTSLSEKNLIFNEKLKIFIFNLLFPLALFVGMLLNIDKQKIYRSFIEVNNTIVRSLHIKIGKDNLLILIPHCIQNNECPIRVTTNIDNCIECGKCEIGELKQLKNKYNLQIAIATGGTIARKYIKELRPKAIIAVACMYDLISGIQDIKYIPVYAILNIRPEGPCFNTRLQIDKIKKVIEELTFT